MSEFNPNPADYANTAQQFAEVQDKLLRQHADQLEALRQAQQEWKAQQQNRVPTKGEIQDHLMERGGFIDDDDDPMPQFQRNIIADHAQGIADRLRDQVLSGKRPVSGYYNVDPGVRSADGIWHRSPSVSLNGYGMDVDGLLSKVNAERARRGRPAHDPHADVRAMAAKIYGASGSSARHYSA